MNTDRTAQPVVAYCGMTHLGINSAIAGAERGFEIICFDPDADLIGGLRGGDTPIVEPDLDRLFATNQDRLTFTSDAADLVRADIAYVAPDVATDGEGRSDLEQINGLLEIVQPALSADAVMVILSQVPPGFTRSCGRSGKPPYYQVETLIFGRAIERALYPERFIVGCADPAEPLHPAYRTYLEAHGCPILPMRYESAELAKIAINCCLVASIGVANTLAELCEGIGADWTEIAPALKLDRRIGEFAYLDAGLGIAGGNLERDLATVCRIGDTVGSDTGVVRAWIENSRHRKTWVADRLLNGLAGIDEPVVAMLGLAYKENTHSTKNAPSIATLERLSGMSVRAYDPVVKTLPGRFPGLRHVTGPLDAAEGADALALMTPWPEFRDLEVRNLLAAMRGRLVVDPWGLLRSQIGDGAALERVLDYHVMGVSG